MSEEKQGAPPGISERAWEGTPHEVRAAFMLLLGRIEQLEIRLSQNSHNSSKPPSSDGPSVPRPPKKAKNKKRGAPYNHQGHTRTLVAVEKVDQLKEYYPTSCRSCTQALEQGATCSIPPIRHQVWEIPPIKPMITEYRLHAGVCPHCQTQTRAELPTSVARGNFGPRLQAVTALLHGRFRVSMAETQALLGDLFGVEMSMGSVSTICQNMSSALEEVYDEVGKYLRAAPNKNMDETGWKQEGKRQWLWVACNKGASLFSIKDGRSAKVAKELLGDYAGILTSDRLGSYNIHPTERRQICWAHLMRNMVGLSETRGAVGRWGRLGVKLVEQLFKKWQQFKSGTIKRPSFERGIARIESRLRVLCSKGSKWRTSCVSKMSKNLLRLWPALWTFAREEGVEPTNNAAEQALRAAVLWRKGCFGTQSGVGSRFVERILSIAQTAQKQGRHLLTFLGEALETHWQGLQAPSLFPNT